MSIRRDESGQVTLLIIGFATILLMAIVVVIDASAAYLQRQGLDNLADGAALHGADLGSAGVYTDGLPEDRLLPEPDAVRAAVQDYLHASGARERYPGIQVSVAVDPTGRSVTVSLRAPVDLPLTMPGWSAPAMVGASSTAAVTVLEQRPSSTRHDDPVTTLNTPWTILGRTFSVLLGGLGQLPGRPEDMEAVRMRSAQHDTGSASTAPTHATVRPLRTECTELSPGQVWDRHGAVAYSLACVLLGDEAAATQAVTLGMMDLARTEDGVPPETARRSLARRVFLRSQERVAETSRTLDLPPAMVWIGKLAPLQRACLALCVFGDHTHHEAAELLEVPPMTVAELLTAGLRDLGGLAAEDQLGA